MLFNLLTGPSSVQSLSYLLHHGTLHRALRMQPNPSTGGNRAVQVLDEQEVLPLLLAAIQNGYQTSTLGRANETRPS